MKLARGVILGLTIAASVACNQKESRGQIANCVLEEKNMRIKVENTIANSDGITAKMIEKKVERIDFEIDIKNGRIENLEVHCDGKKCRSIEFDKLKDIQFGEGKCEIKLESSIVRPRLAYHQ